MVRTILILFFLALCALYAHQSQKSEVPLPPEHPRTVDDSGLRALKRTLPSVIFEKDVLPAIERNRSRGLTEHQIKALAEKLETAGRALGEQATEAVSRAIRTMDPQYSPPSGVMEQSLKAANGVFDSLKSVLPDLEYLGGAFIRCLTTALSRLLDMAAHVLGV